MIPRLPPTSSGVTYSPTVGMNTMKKAARTPESQREVVVQKRRQEVARIWRPPQPVRLCLAFRKAALMGKAAKGTHT